MQRAQSLLDHGGVVFLAVNTGQRRDIVARFVERLKITLPVLLDDGRTVSDRWLARALPVSYVIAPDGHVAYGVVGDHGWDAPDTVERLRALSKPGVR